MAADVQHQRRLAGRQAQQRKAELVVPKHAVLIRVQAPCKSPHKVINTDSADLLCVYIHLLMFAIKILST